MLEVELKLARLAERGQLAEVVHPRGEARSDLRASTRLGFCHIAQLATCLVRHFSCLRAHPEDLCKLCSKPGVREQSRRSPSSESVSSSIRRHSR